MPELCDDVPRRRRSAEAARRPGSLRQLPARIRRDQQHHLRRGSDRPRRPPLRCRLEQVAGERRRAGAGRARRCRRSTAAATAIARAAPSPAPAACGEPGDVLRAGARTHGRRAAACCGQSRGAVLPDAQRSTDRAPGRPATAAPSEPLEFARAGRRCGSAAHSRHVALGARGRPRRRAVVLQDPAGDTTAAGSAVHDRSGAGVGRRAAGARRTDPGSDPGTASPGRKPVDPSARLRAAAVVQRRKRCCEK